MMSTMAPVSDMLVTVKSREIQRGMLAETRGDKTAAARHLLAASHLELVLADDYLRCGQHDLAIRSRLSAASCLWRAGRCSRAVNCSRGSLRRNRRGLRRSNR
jgi:uncharacterized protein (UPF0262 family)